MKDREGKYIMVNPRWEELFGLTDQEVRGRSVYEFFSKETADIFWGNDRQVLNSRRPCQAEERFSLDSVVYNYLSVRFPILDETRGGDQAVRHLRGHHRAEKGPGPVAQTLRGDHQQPGERAHGHRPGTPRRAGPGPDRPEDGRGLAARPVGRNRRQGRLPGDEHVRPDRQDHQRRAPYRHPAAAPGPGRPGPGGRPGVVHFRVREADRAGLRLFPRGPAAPWTSPEPLPSSGWSRRP